MDNLVKRAMLIATIRRRSINVIAIAVVALISGRAVGQAEPKLNVPEGFSIERIAGEPQVKFPMFAALDDVGRLYVAESSGLDLYAELQAQTRKCRVRRLEDRDGDGRLETSTIFADDLVFPMGLAWRGGRLYVADPPDLVVYEDANNDGRGDARKVILTGFGHKDNGSLHGLIFGPDGWLYMTMGCPDGYKLKRADGSVVEGLSGALIRCREDGSHPEVVCRGFVNLVEVAFTPRGDILGTDNWFRDANQPGSDGLRDALVHLVEGGLYPYHPEVGTPQPTTGISMGPVGLYPAVALSGVERYRGSSFPPEMVGNVFTAQHNARKVVRHVLVADGSTFRAEDVDFVTTDDPDFHPSDVLEAADGSLLVIDTGSWYIHHCPTGRIRNSSAPGGIYRVSRIGAKHLKDPLAQKKDWAVASVDRLLSFLADSRPAVRDRAQAALIARGEAAVPALSRLLNESADTRTRQLAIWTLCRIGGKAAPAALRSALRDKDVEVVTAAARALSRRGDREAGPALGKLLAADPPAVQLAAAEALAHCGSGESLANLWHALAGEHDRLVEHAMVHAVHHLADASELEAALDHEHPAVQRAALILLSQPPRPRERLTHQMVLARVAASDDELRQVALSILHKHPEWTEPAMSLLAGWLREPNLSPERSQALRGSLLAFQEQPALQQFVTSSLVNATDAIPAQRQVEILETIEQISLAELPPDWIEPVGKCIEKGQASVQAQAVRTAAVWQVQPLDEPLLKFARDRQQSAALRIEALRAVIARHEELDEPLFALLLDQLKAAEEPLSRLRAAEVLGSAKLTADQKRSLIAAARGDSLVSPELILPALTTDSSADLAKELLDYLSQSIRDGWRPSEQYWQQLRKTFPDGVASQVASVQSLWEQAAEQQSALLTEYSPLLTGGDVQRGRSVFLDRKVACSACHRVGREGGMVGPDLTRIGAIRSPRDLLESIVLPSSTFAQGFENYAVLTDDGRMASGVIVRQDDRVLVLRDASGAQQRLARASIENISRQSKSLMPDGLPRALTRDQFRDLLAYLQSLK